MLDRIRQYHIEHPDRKAFFKILETIFPPTSSEYALVEKAYNRAKDAFSKKYREGGVRERYFEHLRRVTLIGILHLGVRDVHVIVALILHDIVEDIEEWTNEMVALHFTKRSAELLWWVTKRPVSEFNGNKEARNLDFNLRLLLEAPRETALIKMPDRFDNNNHMKGLPLARQKRKVLETRTFYLPYAKKHNILFHESLELVEKVEASWLKK